MLQMIGGTLWVKNPSVHKESRQECAKKEGILSEFLCKILSISPICPNILACNRNHKNVLLWPYLIVSVRLVLDFNIQSGTTVQSPYKAMFGIHRNGWAI